METAVYFGVECSICRERLPLVEVISAPQVISWEIPVVKPFRARCERCGSEGNYAYKDVFVFPGPPPAPDFDIHSVFNFYCRPKTPPMTAATREPTWRALPCCW